MHVTELVFDDESLDRILYGAQAPGPTPTDVFRQTREEIKRIKNLFQEGDSSGGLDEIRYFSLGEGPWSIPACRELAGILARFIPCIPCPVLSHDLKGLDRPLERICEIAGRAGECSLLEGAQTLLYRCHEHLENFEAARRVLEQTLAADRQRGETPKLAYDLNNLGFEYLLEGRWREALSYFERAAAIAVSVGYAVETANMRCNYWTARVELDGVGAELEAEIRQHLETLRNAGDWRQRKALILFARIEEARDDLGAAIEYAEQAVAAALESATRWPEIDTAYLTKLRSMRRDRRGEA